MAKSNNSRVAGIWWTALILLVCVAATAVAFSGRLDSFLPDDEGAICLIPDGTGDAGSGTSATQASAIGGDTSETSAVSTASVAAPQVTQPEEAPGFEVGDDNTVWSTCTQVEIFHVSYMNGERILTVNSDDGDKVIAPGTENSYTFKLKNTGNVALEYTVEVDAFFAPANIEIPIVSRLSRYDGAWVIGGTKEYVTVSALDTAQDSASLGAGKYTYYTLDWLWPFESGNDESDTLLGDLAAEQDLTFTIVIKTTATRSSDPYDNSGITPPRTGDDMDLALWIVLAVSSFAMMMFVLFCRNRENRRYSTEADKN